MAIDAEQAALLRGVLAMTPDEVRALPPEQRESVQQVRSAATMPLEAIRALPQPVRDEMLQMRNQLGVVLGMKELL